MTIAAKPIGDAAIGAIEDAPAPTKKPPRNRTTTAKADSALLPEAR